MSERKKTARTGDCPAACDKNESAKAQKKTSAKKKVRTALMSTVIALSASAIAGLSVALYYSEQRAGEQQSYISSMEAVYSRSYYDLLDSANDLEVQLMKLRAAGTPEAQSRILYDVWQTATSASPSSASEFADMLAGQNAIFMTPSRSDTPLCLHSMSGNTDIVFFSSAKTDGVIS